MMANIFEPQHDDDAAPGAGRPVLIVGAAPSSGHDAVIADLATQVVSVIAADGGAAVCLGAKVLPDIVVGDFDSLDEPTRASLDGSGTALVTHPSDKDRTDLALACELARELGATSVIVTCAFTGRMDHTLAALGALLEVDDLSPRIVEPAWMGWILCAKARSNLELHAPGSTFSVVPLAGTACVSLSGARWPLERATLEPLSGLGVSNTAGDDHILIEVHAGTVLVTVLTQDGHG